MPKNARRLASPPGGAPQAQRAASSRGGAVPYIVRWSGEQNAPMTVVMQRGGRGIRYADERTYDRDARGVLWGRVPSQPGRGKPVFGETHSLRQRLAMSQLRCQICGGPADQNTAGVLWIIDGQAEDIRPGDEETAHPPVCRPCAHRSVIACPHLRDRFTAVRVRGFAPMGVKGALYGLGPKGPEVVDAVALTFTDPRLPYLRAHQLIMRLHDFTLINLNDPTT